MDLDVDLNMDLDMDLSGASPLATVRSAGACLGPVWGFPAGYGAIRWGLSGTCLGPVWGFPAVYGAISWGLSGTCLGPNADFAGGFLQFLVPACYKC